MSQRSHVQTSTVQRIRDQCRKFLDGTVSVQSSTSASHSYQPQSTVVYPPVPYPSPIVTTLLQAGAPFNLADVVSRAYLRSALNLKRDCEHHIQRVARVWVETSTESGTISSQIQSIHSVFVSQYRQSLNHLAEQTLILVRSKLTFPTRKEGRNAFDKGTISVLEAFYAQDPFPSSDDRRTLAKQTKLTSEQIRIWFQNRRARAKRSGHPPSRRIKLSRFVPCQPDSALSDFESEMAQLIDDEISRSTISRPMVEVVTPSHSLLWPPNAPAHAFPSSYPPSCDPEPFPKDGLMNFDIPWPREAIRVRSTVDHSTSDIPTLVDSFCKMSLDDDLRANIGACRSTPTLDSFSPIPSMWIPVKSPASPAVLSPVNVCISRPRRNLSARSSLRENNTLQPRTSNDSSSRVKPYSRPKPQPSLPRRIPQSQPQLINYRLSSSQSQHSRSSSASSFNSDDSSYTSSSDSEIGTPPPLSTNLPVYFPKKDSLPSYISPISLPKLSRALSKSPTASRTYTFRTTIAPS